jgi:hypothetical protein
MHRSMPSKLNRCLLMHATAAASQPAAAHKLQLPPQHELPPPLPLCKSTCDAGMHTHANTTAFHPTDHQANPFPHPFPTAPTRTHSVQANSVPPIMACTQPSKLHTHHSKNAAEQPAPCKSHSCMYFISCSTPSRTAEPST